MYGYFRIKGFQEKHQENFRVFASVPEKRYLIGLLFPEKLSFSDSTCRTGRINCAAELIHMENKELRLKKMGQKTLETSLPHTGSVVVRNSNNFVDELIEIGVFGKILDQ